MLAEARCDSDHGVVTHGSRLLHFMAGKRSENRNGRDLPKSRPPRPSPCLGGGVLGVVLDDERVDTVFVMHLAAGHRRVEDAQHTEVRLRANRVLLVAVEEIKGARGDGELLPGLLVHQLGLTLDAVHEFDVVGVLERRLGARVQDGLVEGETDFLPGKDDPTAAPVLRLDVVIGVADLVQATNDHWYLLHPLNASVDVSWDMTWGRRTDPVPRIHPPTPHRK